MMPPLNIDKEVLMWAGVGFCVLLCGVVMSCTSLNDEGAEHETKVYVACAVIPPTHAAIYR